MSPPWHQLPAVVFKVLGCLKSNIDVLHAACVCTAWADAAAAVPLPAKLHWSTDDTPEDKAALAWASRNWSRVHKLALDVADGEGQQAAAQQLLAAAAQAATALHHLAIKASGSEPLPEETWRLTALHSLCLSKSWHSKFLPEQVVGLQALQQLALSSCALQELPASIGQLQQLTQLTINECHYLEALPKRCVLQRGGPCAGHHVQAFCNRKWFLYMHMGVYSP
jgi:acyl carrier protein phosphodiesterase